MSDENFIFFIFYILNNFIFISPCNILIMNTSLPLALTSSIREKEGAEETLSNTHAKVSLRTKMRGSRCLTPVCRKVLSRYTRRCSQATTTTTGEWSRVATSTSRSLWLSFSQEVIAHSRCLASRELCDFSALAKVTGKRSWRQEPARVENDRDSRLNRRFV